MAEQDVTAIVEAFFEDWNSEDPNLVAKHFSNTATMNCAGVPWAMEGSAILERISVLLRDCPGMRFSVRECIVLNESELGTETVVRWTGQIPDAITGPAGARTVTGLDRVVLKGGEVQLLDSFYDRMELAADLVLASKRL